MFVSIRKFVKSFYLPLWLLRLVGWHVMLPSLAILAVCLWLVPAFGANSGDYLNQIVFCVAAFAVLQIAYVVARGRLLEPLWAIAIHLISSVAYMVAHVGIQFGFNVGIWSLADGIWENVGVLILQSSAATVVFAGLVLWRYLPSKKDPDGLLESIDSNVRRATNKYFGRTEDPASDD